MNFAAAARRNTLSDYFLDYFSNEEAMEDREPDREAVGWEDGVAQQVRTLASTRHRASASSGVWLASSKQRDALVRHRARAMSDHNIHSEAFISLIGHDLNHVDYQQCLEWPL